MLNNTKREALDKIVETVGDGGAYKDTKELVIYFGVDDSLAVFDTMAMVMSYINTETGERVDIALGETTQHDGEGDVEPEQLADALIYTLLLDNVTGIAAADLIDEL